MDEKERFKILEEEKINKDIYFYLKNLFKQLYIEITGRYEGNIFDLMVHGKLEGWCWQTTESAALFMPDDTIVYRGYLFFNKYKRYYHSFILFKYDDIDYIFDPCLRMINTANLYLNTFNAYIKGFTSAKDVKDYFVNYVNNPPKKNYWKSEIPSSTDRFMKKFFGDDYIVEKKKEIIITDKENPYAPMYRNNSGYKNVDITNGKVKSLTVHYYINA